MAEHSVKISPAAQTDLIDIVFHLGALSPEEATQYYELFVEKMEILKTSPDVCPLSRDTQLRLRGYRMLLIDSYIVFYVIKDKTVELRRILYARRQYDRLV